MAAGDKLLLESGIPGEYLDLDSDVTDDLLLEAAAAGLSFTATQGVIHLTGQNATVTTGANLSVTSQQGVIHLTGQNAAVSTGTPLSFTATQGLIYLTGQNASITASRNVTSQSGRIYVKGRNVTVTGLGGSGRSMSLREMRRLERQQLLEMLRQDDEMILPILLQLLRRR